LATFVSPAAFQQSLRLDKYLFFTRLLKTRAHAAALCESRHLRLDGRVIEKAHTTVRIGSIISYPWQGEVVSVKVLKLPLRRGSFPESHAMFEDMIGKRAKVEKNDRDELSREPKRAMPDQEGGKEHPQLSF
jgi:ribosome-associated heat shock protein Hsp15